MKDGGSSRIGLYDAMRGVAIILMVAGHAGMPVAWTRFVYLFHMAVFLMLAGLFHHDPRPADIHGLLAFLRGKLRRLWFPYAFFMALFSLLHNAFVRFSVYSDDPVFLATSDKAVPIGTIGLAETAGRMAEAMVFRGREQVGGAFWFLAVLFQITVLSGLTGLLLDRAGLGCRKRFLQAVFAAALLFLGFQASLLEFRFLMLDIAFSGFALYHAGVLAAPLRKSAENAPSWLFLVAFAVPVPLLLRLSRAGRVSLSENAYPDPAFLLMASVAGFLLVFGTAGIFSRVSFAKRFLEFVGRHTMEILVFHFLAFKLVSAAGVFASGLPRCLIAAFPVLFRGGWWWVAYTAAGVLIPAAGGAAFQFLRRRSRHESREGGETSGRFRS